MKFIKTFLVSPGCILILSGAYSRNSVLLACIWFWSLGSFFNCKFDSPFCFQSSKRKHLLCTSQFELEAQFKIHYITFHNVDPNNYFFKKLFKISKQRIICQKCLWCIEFLATNKHKRLHNTLNQYSDGKTKHFEDEPIDIKKIGNITTYEITAGNHSNFYDFGNSEEFLTIFWVM